jgi:hypothetical protein
MRLANGCCGVGRCLVFEVSAKARVRIGRDAFDRGGGKGLGGETPSGSFFICDSVCARFKPPLPRVAQTREWDGSIFVTCDAINVTLLMHGFASLIACQVSCQIYGLMT